MNKVLDLLEQYCQWLAIALGGIFLALMVWWYLLFSPVTVPGTRGQALTPTSVDAEVHRNYAAKLDEDMRREQVEPPPVQQVSAIEKWDERLNGNSGKTMVVRSDWPASIPQDVKLASTEAPATQEAPVAKLPDIPPSEVVDQKAARAFVLPTVNQPGQPGQPAQPPVQPTAPGQAPVGRDLSYVRLEYRIAPDEIAKSFTAVNIPAQFTNTSVEGITLYRQEQMPDGSWATPTKIALINNGVQIPPPPAAGANPAVIPPFRQWAESQQGQTDLLRPPFYQVTQGEGPWDPPADQLPVIDPKAELLKKQAAYRAAQDALRQKRMQSVPQREPSDGPPGMPGRYNGRGRGGPPGMQPLQWPQAQPPGNYPPGAVRPPTGMFDPNAPGMQNPGDAPTPAPIAPGSGQPNANPLPAPIFKPSETQPFIGWAYDESVAEGKTYRYQVIYAIRNPVYLSNIVANPAMAQTFLLWSTIDDNAWSKPVTVKASTEYFLSGPSWASNTPSSVRVEVFKWSKGQWQSHVFNVAPGDEIGGPITGPDGVTDFSTHSIVVDARYDVRVQRAYLLVLGPDGKMTEHDPSVDRNSPRLAQLRLAIQQAANPNGVPNANNPNGAFPPGMSPNGMPDP